MREIEKCFYLEEFCGMIGFEADETVRGRDGGRSGAGRRAVILFTKKERKTG